MGNPFLFSCVQNEQGFDLLAKKIVELTNFENSEINLTALDFVTNIGEDIKVIFKNFKESKHLALIEGDCIVFTLDEKYWDRLFRFFILMSWDKATYYLNAFEDALLDLGLEQECNFICSSEF